MSQLIGDILAYLKAVFVETWQKIFTFFDILGVILFCCPKLAEPFVNEESQAKTIGVLIFFVSFLLANFSLYRKMTVAVVDKADIRLEVIEKGFSHARSSGRRPFREILPNPNGFDKQGTPDWCSLWARIEVANIGYEKGVLDCEIDASKTKLPTLFINDPNKSHVDFESPASIEARSKYSKYFFFDVQLAERDPLAFAESLRSLVKSKQKYQIVLRYKTKRVDGESEARRLSIKGDFHDFCQEVLKYWNEHGFKELASLAQIAS